MEWLFPIVTLYLVGGPTLMALVGRRMIQNQPDWPVWARGLLWPYGIVLIIYEWYHQYTAVAIPSEDDGEGWEGEDIAPPDE